MKTKILIGAFIILVIIKFFEHQNRKKPQSIKNKTQRKVNKSAEIKNINESSYNNYKVSKLLITMLEEFNLHDEIQPTLSESEIIEIEKQLNLTLPISYKLFLKYFGDGGDWVYTNSIDSIKTPTWLIDYRNHLGEKIVLDGEKEINVDTLLCLMNEDSNGGAWCWLTSEYSKDGEWSLAYYSMSDNKLHYKVQNFTEWLKILIDSKGEVIRELDLEYKLGLG